MLAQSVDATQASNLSAGVSNVKVLRGRSRPTRRHRQELGAFFVTAFAYACEIVPELMQNLHYRDRSSLVKVRDETRPMVLSIPFLAACA